MGGGNLLISQFSQILHEIGEILTKVQAGGGVTPYICPRAMFYLANLGGISFGKADPLHVH